MSVLNGCGARRALTLAAAVATVAAGLSAGPAVAAATWEMYTYNPVATVAGVRGLVTAAETVEKETGGQLKIKLHLGGSLPIKATNITQAVGDNIVQMGADSFFTGNIPMAGVIRLPMLLHDDAEYAKALAIVEPYMTAAYAKKGIVVLGVYSYPQQVAWSRKPLASLGEIKGQKLRVTSPEQGEFLKRYGGTSVTLGAAEVPAAIDRGVIDGGFTASSGLGWVWRDLVKHNYRIGVNYVNSVVIANKEAFDALSPDAQGKLRKAVTEATPWITATMREDEQELTRKLAEAGITVTAAKPEDVQDAQKAMAPYWDEWAKAHGPDAIEALGKIRTALGR